MQGGRKRYVINPYMGIIAPFSNFVEDKTEKTNAFYKSAAHRQPTKNIYGQKMGNNTNFCVVVKSFLGATTGDMEHYIKPTLERNSDHVILHIGN